MQRAKAVQWACDVLLLVMLGNSKCLTQVSELQWRQRVRIQGYKGDAGIFEFMMTQRFGGRYDGIWFTEQLVADDCDLLSLVV